MHKRKHYSASQKAHIALGILKEEKTITQIASEQGIHPNVLYHWNKQALEIQPRLLEDESKCPGGCRSSLVTSHADDLEQRSG